jgi:hypothetical protein
MVSSKLASRVEFCAEWDYAIQIMIKHNIKQVEIYFIDINKVIFSFQAISLYQNLSFFKIYFSKADNILWII